MEFPELGKRCGESSCENLDFLPIQCAFCRIIFCKEHAQVSGHKCNQAPDNVVTEKKSIETFKCSADGCSLSDVIEMKCTKCERHHCLEHRHHGCLDAPPTLTKRQKERLPKQQFLKAKAETDAMVRSLKARLHCGTCFETFVPSAVSRDVQEHVQEKLKQAKNRALANKIKLMKIKGSAIGLKTIPTTNRIYFLVAPPLGSLSQVRARALFIDKLWSTGKTIDFFSKKFNKDNTNNNLTGPQLRLFNSEGVLLSDDLSVTINELIDDGTVVNGDSIILEYITPEEIKEGSNIFVKNGTLEKYNFL